MFEPYQEAEAREARWDRLMERCPRCDRCGCHILPEEYRLTYGEITLCNSCVDTLMECEEMEDCG